MKRNIFLMIGSFMVGMGATMMAKDVVAAQIILFGYVLYLEENRDEKKVIL
jgi:hypothetical protein